jgi:hypothetical protein
VLAAGLLAHIEIDKAPTAGGIWRFAGLDPTAIWEKGQKRPHCGALKVLAWKIGQSFLKQSGRELDKYGHVLMERKEYETLKNERGDYAAQAVEILKRVPSHKQKAIYATGKLSPGHLLSRASRYSVKLFLSHYHHVAYELRFGTPPPKPYIIAHGGHTHFLAPPNWDYSAPNYGMAGKPIPAGLKLLP